MRTSYDRYKVEPAVKEVEQSKKEESVDDSIRKGKLMETYLAIEEELSYIREEEMRGYTDAINSSADGFTERELELERRRQLREDEEDEIDDEEDGESVEEDEDFQKGSSTRKKVIIGASIAAAVVVLGVGGVVGYNTFFGSTKKLETIQTRISKMYTTPDKVDIKSGVSQEDLNSFYTELLELYEDGEDVNSPIEELDTIGYFLNDKNKLMDYNSESYDLTTTGLVDSVSSITDNTKVYSVSGLAVTINNLASQITEDYNYFIDLRQELNGISDVLSFDETMYKGKVDAVDHVPNRTELTAIIDKLVVDKQAEEAQKKVQEAADEQTKADAEKALQEAQELQKRTQEELESTKKKLEEEAKKAAEAVKKQEEQAKENQQLNKQQKENDKKKEENSNKDSLGGSELEDNLSIQPMIPTEGTGE